MAPEGSAFGRHFHATSFLCRALLVYNHFRNKGIVRGSVLARGRRSGTIELFRFVFCVVVILFHAQNAFLQGFGDPNTVHWTLCGHGNAAVEFFFLVSGYLMAASLSRMDEPSGERELARDTQMFFVRKIRPIWWYHVLFYVPSLITYLLVKAFDGLGTLNAILRAIPGFFFVDLFGFRPGNPNSVEWYISAMLIVMFVFYPIMRRHFAMFAKVVAPIVALALLGWLYKNEGALTGVMVWNGLAYRAMLRGFAEIALGIALFDLIQQLDRLELARAHRRLLTAAQMLAFVLALVCICLTLPQKYEFVILLLLAIGVSLSFSQHSLANDVLKGRVIMWLGAFSTPLYLAQVTALNLLHLTGDAIDPWPRAWLMLGLSCVFALVAYGVVTHLLPRGKRHSKA